MQRHTRMSRSLLGHSAASDQAVSYPLSPSLSQLLELHSPPSFCEVTPRMVESMWYLSTSDWFHVTNVSSVIRVVTNHRISLLDGGTTFPLLVSCWMLQLFPCLPVWIALQWAGAQRVYEYRCLLDILLHFLTYTPGRKFPELYGCLFLVLWGEPTFFHNGFTDFYSR